MRVSVLALATTAMTVTGGTLVTPAHAVASDNSSYNIPPAATGSCVVRKTEVTASNAFDDSTSMGWVNLGASGSVTFTESANGCVSGTFSASAGNASANDSVRLQILLDGNPCEPLTGNYSFANYGADFSSHPVEYFCGIVAKGTHTVQVQYHSGSGGDAQFYQRTLEVRHN